MNEVAHSGTPDGPTPEHLLDNFEDQELHRGQEATEGLREAQEAWLERRGIEPNILQWIDERLMCFEMPLQIMLATLRKSTMFPRTIKMAHSMHW